MGECSTQELMEEQLSKSWQKKKNKLTIRDLFIFLRGKRGCQLRSITLFAPLHPNRLSAVSETLSEKEGSLC